MPTKDYINKSRKNIRISDLQAFYLVITTVFIFTGFIYNFIFFRFFNIRVEHFFTLEDYLASSIEKVYLIIMVLLFSVASNSMARYMINKRIIFSHRLIRVWFYSIPIIIFLAGILVVTQYNKAWGYFLLSFSIYISIDCIIFKFISRGNQDSYSRFIYFTAFILYMLLIFSTVLYDRDSVLNKSVHSLKNYQVYLSSTINLNPDHCIVLEANSNYFFFYDKEIGKAYVIPRNKISYIEATK